MEDNGEIDKSEVKKLPSFKISNNQTQVIKIVKVSFFPSIIKFLNSLLVLNRERQYQNLLQST